MILIENFETAQSRQGQTPAAGSPQGPAPQPGEGAPYEGGRPSQAKPAPPPGGQAAKSARRKTAGERHV